MQASAHLVAPFAGAAGVAGGGEAECGHPIAVLLAFSNEGRRALGPLQQFRQPVRHLPDAFDRPVPAAAAVGLALPEILRVEATNLEQQAAVLVAIVIRRNDAALPCPLRLIVEADAELGGQPLDGRTVRETRLAVNQVEDAAADLMLILPPGPAIVAVDVDTQRPVGALAPLGGRGQGAVRLAEQPSCDRLDMRGEVCHRSLSLAGVGAASRRAARARSHPSISCSSHGAVFVQIETAREGALTLPPQQLRVLVQDALIFGSFFVEDLEHRCGLPSSAWCRESRTADAQRNVL